MADMKILSWNVNGLNGKVKVNKIAHILKKQNLDTICLQETHIAKRQITVKQRTLFGICIIRQHQATRSSFVY